MRRARSRLAPSLDDMQADFFSLRKSSTVFIQGASTAHTGFELNLFPDVAEKLEGQAVSTQTTIQR